MDLDSKVEHAILRHALKLKDIGRWQHKGFGIIATEEKTTAYFPESAQEEAEYEAIIQQHQETGGVIGRIIPGMFDSKNGVIIRWEVKNKDKDERYYQGILYRQLPDSL